MTAPSGLIYRDESTEPQDRSPVHELLRDVFGLDVSPLTAFGLADPTYRAFSYLDAAGCCVANAATFTLGLIVNGKPVTAMGIQSVATRPAWRRRGLSHDLLERALRWCDAQAPLTFLMTAIPAFYQPMGFRIVPQSAHIGPAPAASARSSRCRRLQLDTAADRHLLTQILRHRIPVSERFAVDGAAGAFVLALFDEPELSAWYIAPQHAIVVTAARTDGTLCIVDVAASAMPALGDIVAAFGSGPDRVEVHFPPDRLAWNGTPTPSHGATLLMVRGALEPLAPFMIPATASF